MLTQIQHSLSAKLIALFICTGAILLLLVGSIMGRGFSQHFKSGIEPFMIHYIELMQQQLGSPPNAENARRITANTPVDIHVFGPDSKWTTADNYLDTARLVSQGQASSNSDADAKYQLHRTGHKLFLETHEGDYQIYFQINNTDALKPGAEYSMIVLGLIIAILILIYFVTRSIFRPIEDIEKGVKLFGEGNLLHKIPKRRNDQLGELTDSVNQMAEDISQMLEAKRQFLLGISHELRSPLARCKVNLALLEDSSARSDINHDIEAMDSLIGELLESERLNSPHRVIQPEEIRVDALITELAESEFSGHNIDLKLDPVTSSVDPARMRLLLRNIIQNALKYNTGNHNKAPLVRLKKDSKIFTISVQDFGQGIAREHIPFLTEPFYRADPSRRRLTGGYGLGLYLCRMIMRAHSGHIKVTSEVGKGTRISCRFPIS
jgi:signal transduction histidine kinase